MFDLDFLGSGPNGSEDEIDPMLAGFKLDYKDEAEDFNWNLLQEAGGGGQEEKEEKPEGERLKSTTGARSGQWDRVMAGAGSAVMHALGWTDPLRRC